jgi:hypothetical protein
MKEVNSMLSKKGSLFLAALLALALPLALAGNAGAKSLPDGSKQNGTTGGWDLTDQGVCVTGIAASGTMSIDASKKSRADCLSVLYPAYTTSAACTSFTNAEGSSHYWTSVCVSNADPNVAISLSGLDRTAANCTDLGGTWKSACTGAWVYTGPAGDGAPGYCYMRVQLNGAGYDSTTCAAAGQPIGFLWDTTHVNCDFTYGIVGYVDGNITKKDGTAGPVRGTYVDLTGYTSQGKCLADGYSWSTGATKSGTTTIATSPLTTTVAVATGNRAGCLECHNSGSQYNSYYARWKDAYLKTGHKNMLRKVTPGMNWAGPDGAIYTGAASGQTINFVTGEATGSYGTAPLMYLFGDWMAPAPDALDTVVWLSGSSKAQYNGTSTYSCAACHSTGWSNPTAGVCSISSKTTQSTCTTAGGTWYPSVGIEGASYNPSEPGASWPLYKNADNTVNGITGRWDRDGIVCSRCHNSVFPATLPQPTGTSTHTNAPAGAAVTNLCFGCHQSIAKTANGTGADNDLNPVVLQVKNTATAPAYKPEFNSHPIGNEFLNSTHAKFTGTMVPNALGKYDIVGADVLSNYGSQHFYGKDCRATATSANILETFVKPDKTVGIIKSQADCTEAGGVWVDDNETANATANTGRSCATCHDVHQSTVPAVNATEPFRRECDGCHNRPLTMMNHPSGTGTPLGDMTDVPAACEKCHMPKATADGFPIHLFRINPNAAYSTFPSADEFLGNTKKVANTSPDGTYASAVWVDLDLACGQCHGGGSNSTDNPPSGNAPYKTKAALGVAAQNMHNAIPVVKFTWSADTVASLTINFDASSTICPTGATCNYTWDFGDASTGTGITTSHTYADTAPRTVTLTVDTFGTYYTSASASQAVVPVDLNTAPVASKTAPVVSGMTVSFTDTSTDKEDAQSALTVNVNWGDGSGSTGKGGELFSHTYSLAGTYTIRHSVTDTGGLTSSSANVRVTIAEKYSISGTVKDGLGTGVQGVTMYLKSGTTLKKTVTTIADGTYSFVNLLTGCYYVVPAMTGKTFLPAQQTVCVGPSKTAIDFTAQ